MLRPLWPGTQQTFCKIRKRRGSSASERQSTTHGESGDEIFPKQSKPGTGTNVAELFRWAKRTCQSRLGLWLFWRRRFSFLVRLGRRLLGLRAFALFQLDQTAFIRCQPEFEVGRVFFFHRTMARDRRSGCCDGTWDHQKNREQYLHLRCSMSTQNMRQSRMKRAQTRKESVSDRVKIG